MQSLSEVDSKRIGFIGHSYGARMALWLPAFDKRIKVSVSNCGCINYKDSLSRDISLQIEFCVPSILKYGDIEDIIKLVEPCNLFISATDDDIWSKSARKIYLHAKPFFKKGELKLQKYSGQHVFSPTMKKNAYAFLDKYLKTK